MLRDRHQQHPLKSDVVFHPASRQQLKQQFTCWPLSAGALQSQHGDLSVSEYGRYGGPPPMSASNQHQQQTLVQGPLWSSASHRSRSCSNHSSSKSILELR